MTDRDKQEVFRKMKELNMLKAVCEYNGGHDEGGVESVVCTYSTGTVEQLDDDDLWELMAQPVYDEYGSFAGEFSCYGTVVWDLTGQTVTMNDNVSEETYSNTVKTL